MLSLEATQIIKLVRDYGFIVTVIAATMTIAPTTMVWVTAGFTLINCGSWRRASYLPPGQRGCADTCQR